MELNPNPVDDENEERLPWHKPELQRLHVTFDTAAQPGSGIDLEDGAFIET